VSQSSSASDLITLSLASLQAGAPGAATNWILRADRNLAIVRPSLRPDCSGLCAGCFLDLCRPHTRRRGLATGSLRRDLCGWFAAFVLRRRTRKSLSPSPTSRRRHQRFACGSVKPVQAAYRTHAGRRSPRGPPPRRRKLGPRRRSLPSGMSSFRGWSWRLAFRSIASDVSSYDLPTERIANKGAARRAT
jgi:hypothetical protein